MKRVELPDLPYSYDALEPVISERIMRLHHSVHHAGYVKGANAAMDRLERLMDGGEGNAREILRDLSFHMNGHLLHSTFWRVMRKPSESNEPGGRIADHIDRNFGSWERFRRLFSSAAASVEGSGWVVLAEREGEMAVMGIEKHNLNHLAGFTPVLVLDVWEHAYYLDYENRRKDYVENFWKVVDWDGVERLLG